MEGGREPASLSIFSAEGDGGVCREGGGGRGIGEGVRPDSFGMRLKMHNSALVMLAVQAQSRS